MNPQFEKERIEMDTLKMKMLGWLRQKPVLGDERGLSTVEYVIILVLIAAAAIGAWVTLGGKVREKIDGANQEMDKVTIEGQGRGQ
jgi:Flp pilus assembly pilin Flp